MEKFSPIGTFFTVRRGGPIAGMFGDCRAQETKRCFLAFLRKLESNNITPIIQYPQPEFPNDSVPRAMAKRMYFGRPMSKVSTTRREHLDKQRFILKFLDKIRSRCQTCYFYDPSEALCSNATGVCRMFRESDLTPFYADGIHLSLTGRHLVMSHFFGNKTSTLAKLISWKENWNFSNCAFFANIQWQ